MNGVSGTPKHPILFFAAERNSPDIIKILCQPGANLSQALEAFSLPVLAYCIFSAEYDLFPLFAMGVDPSDIPDARLPTDHILNLSTLLSIVTRYSSTLVTDRLKLCSAAC